MGMFEKKRKSRRQLSLKDTDQNSGLQKRLYFQV